MSVDNPDSEDYRDTNVGIGMIPNRKELAAEKSARKLFRLEEAAALIISIVDVGGLKILMKHGWEDARWAVAENILREALKK